MNMGTRANTLNKVVGRLQDLPPMPEAVQEAMRLMESPNADASEISAAIERDPALTAKFLKLSNSSYYGLKRQVSSIRLALVVLGMREVRNVLLGMAAFDVAHGRIQGDPLIQDLWRHSLEVAALSKKLGAELHLGLQGEDFVAGLLHDVGKAVMLFQFGQKYRDLGRKATPEEPLHVREKSEFEINHAEVGAALLQHWSLPEALVDALWFHHAENEMPLQEAKDPSLAAVVRLANLASHDDFSAGPPNSRACHDYDAWSQLEDAPGAKPPDEWYEMLWPIKEEVRQLPLLAFD
jgi:putative nucleotidyltransferase with HDIG domain